MVIDDLILHKHFGDVCVYTFGLAGQFALLLYVNFDTESRRRERPGERQDGEFKDVEEVGDTHGRVFCLCR